MGNATSNLPPAFHSRDEIILLGKHNCPPVFDSSLIKKKLEVKRISKEAIVQVEKLQFRNLTIAIGNGPFDVSTSQVWRRQMKQTRGLIVVVDTSSYFRLQQSKRDLHSLLTTYDEMAAAPILVVATNQKSPGALSDSKIANHLDLFNLPNTWSIYSSTPDHVVGGLLWLSREIRQPNNDLNPDKGKIIEMSSFDEDMPEQVDL